MRHIPARSNLGDTRKIAPNAVVTTRPNFRSTTSVASSTCDSWPPVDRRPGAPGRATVPATVLGHSRYLTFKWTRMPPMAFGQQSGPPASAKQVRELLDLLKGAGHSDFRDARGPMGFTQRQAAGKFSHDEATEF